MSSQFLPVDVDQAIQARLAAKLNGISVGSIGDLSTDENGELVFDPPCARTMYEEGVYDGANENQMLTYDAATHRFSVWCADENLTSLEAQRQASLSVVSLVLPVLAGARLALQDGSQTEPVRILSVEAALQEKLGAPVQTVYVVKIEVPGIAQFPAHAEGE